MKKQLIPAILAAISIITLQGMTALRSPQFFRRLVSPTPRPSLSANLDTKLAEWNTILADVKDNETNLYTQERLDEADEMLKDLNLHPTLTDFAGVRFLLLGARNSSSQRESQEAISRLIVILDELNNLSAELLPKQLARFSALNSIKKRTTAEDKERMELYFRLNPVR